jgi:hypothetical protein
VIFCRLQTFAEAYLYHLQHLLEAQVVVIEDAATLISKDIFKHPQTEVYGSPDDLSDAAAPVDVIILAATSPGQQSSLTRLKTLFHLLRPGGWFVIEGFSPDSPEAGDLYSTVQVMHRMYFKAKEHRGYTVLGAQVDHAFKSVHFWHGAVFIEKGVRSATLQTAYSV